MKTTIRHIISVEVNLADTSYRIDFLDAKRSEVGDLAKQLIKLDIEAANRLGVKSVFKVRPTWSIDTQETCFNEADRIKALCKACEVNIA